MNSEIVLNLWYVRDAEGIIYSLRVKAYVATGSEEEKLAFLQERALSDYLIAEPFDIPPRFYVTIGIGSEAKQMPVAHVAVVQPPNAPIALFEEAIEAIEKRFPTQSNVSIPDDPLICTTPLMQNADGVIEPKVDGQVRYK